MSRADRDSEWTDLVAWVAWIYDLYELSKEERLPHCWTNHPGLIEELRSLKAWRATLYNSPDPGGAHGARSWHGELRQTIAAAATFWSAGCRSGHTDAGTLDDAQGELRQTWTQAGPPRITGPAGRAAAGVPVITDVEMGAALSDGRATTHSDLMPIYAKYTDAWWTRSGDGSQWLRCTDTAHHQHLDATSARLHAANAAHDHLTGSQENTDD